MFILETNVVQIHTFPSSLPEIIANKTWVCNLSKIYCACTNTCLPVPAFCNHFRSLLSSAKYRVMIC